MDGSGGPDADNPHPDKKVPALLHDGALVTESVAIVQYLTDLHPKAGLAPLAGDPKRGAYLTWLAWYAGVVEPVITHEFLKIDHPNLERTFRGRKEVDGRILDALGRHAFLVGDDFSAVDVVFASLGHWFRSALPAGDRVDEYVKACIDRPAFRRAMERDKPRA